MRGSVRSSVLLTLLMLISSLSVSLSAVDDSELDDSEIKDAASTRALIIWSGTVDVPNDFTVAAGDELRINAGSTIQLGPGVRVFIEGKIVAQGTQADPITVGVQPGYIWHDGFQFNATSRNRGSSLRNMTFSDAQFGITIYNSDPVIEDVLFDNVDLVAIDMFDSASPIIRRANFDEGGKDVHGAMTHWRYGIGLSIGASSAPYVEDVTFFNQTTRAISYWGGSGGVIRHVNISDVGGATMNISAGIFVEDSFPLIEHTNISKCDNGIYVLHRTDNVTTRPVFKNTIIGDSQYTAVMMTKVNRANYSVYMMARFHDLEVFGTGGPNSSTPGLAFGTVFLNTSGGWFENVNIHDNTVSGIKLYMTDPSTTFLNTTVTRSGSVLGGTNDRAGLFSRSSNNGGPSLVNLTVSESPGSGIFVSKGSVNGSGWHSHDNGQEGLRVSEMFPVVDNLLLENNGYSGLRVSDSKQVWLSNLTTRNNGFAAPSAQNGAGMVFVESNDLTSAGNIVECVNCTSIGDNWAALRIEESVDIRFVNLEVHDPNVNQGQSAIIIDDSSLSWNGWVEIDGAEIYTNLTSTTPAIFLDEVDAILEGINLHGTHAGIQWTGRGLDSKLGNSTLVGNNCLSVTDVPLLETWGLDVSGCTGNIAISSSDVNLTDFNQGNMALAISGTSYIRSISSQVTIPTLPPSATFDEMWFVDMWAVNQYLHGLPWAEINVTFSQIESDFNLTLPYGGNTELGPFVGQRHTITGSSTITEISTDCTYDNTTGFTGPDSLDQDLSYYLCTISLVNQPPLIIWDEPLNGTVVSSGAALWFNASNSWDLDNDPLTFTWTSSIDGPHTNFCQGLGGSGVANLQFNDGNCVLTDGVHQITLEVCDDQGNCASETRTIEFVNLPPDVVLTTIPAADSNDGVLRVNYTDIVHFNASSTVDYEGDIIDIQEGAEYEGFSAVFNDLEWNRTFAGATNREFIYTVTFSDGLNPTVFKNISVEVQNEYPHPTFSVSRANNYSESEVTLDGSASFDPEGDSISAWWHSSIDGDLNTSISNQLVWSGHLSQGNHTISLRLSDDDSYHINQWSEPYQVTILVENSLPLARIELPVTATSAESADLIQFSAYGSGDWDAPCSEAFPQMSSGWLCNPNSVSNPDTVTPVWTSDQLSEPFGSDWEVQARLPSGTNVVTLTVSDGTNAPASDSITLEISKSAPIIVLTSPTNGIEVISDEVVLFDPQQSWDPDGDNFTFTVTSNLLSEPILDAVDPSFWYSRYVPSGEHDLTFTMTDSDGMSRSETRSIRVLASPPIATISSPLEGQSISPGANVLLDGNESWDPDEDIILYRWYLGQGSSAVLLNETKIANQTLLPGNHLISLQVKDSRGASTWAFTNITVENSWPILDDLLMEPGILTAGEKSTITVRAFVIDADMTTWECVGWASQGGIETNFSLSDDGSVADGFAGDGTWTGQVTVTPGRDGWMNIEVVCRDGPTEDPRLSNRLSSTIKVEGASQHASFLDVISDSVLAIVLGLISLLVVAGLIFSVVRKKRLEADIEMIESWGVGSFNTQDEDDSQTEISTGIDFTEDVDEEEEIPSMVDL